MPANGRRKPPRPRLEWSGGTPRPDEAAAVVAAIERFLAETAPAPATPGPPADAWQRAALVEGVGAKAAFASPWGEGMSWGAGHRVER